MQTSEKVNELNKALFKAKNEMAVVIKNTQAYNYKYADLPSVLNAIENPCIANNLLVIQAPNNENELVTRVIEVESGQWIESKIKLLMAKQDSQALGSAITYNRRYAILGIFGISPEDDDGAATVNSNNVQNNNGTNTSVANKDNVKKPNKEIPNHEWIIPFGKKFKGKRFADCMLDDLDSYANFLINSAKDYGKELTGPAKEFVERVDYEMERK